MGWLGSAGPVLAASAAPLPSASPELAPWLLGLGLGLLAALLLALWAMRLRARRQDSGWQGIDTAPWPALTVFVVARPQDASLSACLQALVGTAYPEKALRIVPVCEAGDAQARAIVKAYAHLFPDRIVPCWREAARNGPVAAWPEVLPLAQGDLAVVLDTRQWPGPGLLKQLAKPFFDAEVGAVLSGVKAVAAAPVPGAAPLPCVGAVRLSAVQAVGGWAGERLADVEALSQRLRARGWSRVVNPQALWSPAPGARKPAAQRPALAEPLAPVAAADPVRKAAALPAHAAPRLMEQT